MYESLLPFFLTDLCREINDLFVYDISQLVIIIQLNQRLDLSLDSVRNWRQIWNIFEGILENERAFSTEWRELGGKLIVFLAGVGEVHLFYANIKMEGSIKI